MDCRCSGRECSCTPTSRRELGGRGDHPVRWPQDPLFSPSRSEDSAVSPSLLRLGGDQYRSAQSRELQSHPRMDVQREFSLAIPFETTPRSGIFSFQFSSARSIVDSGGDGLFYTPVVSGGRIRVGGALTDAGAPRSPAGHPWPDDPTGGPPDPAEFLSMLWALFTCRCRLTVNGVTIAYSVAVPITVEFEARGPGGVPHVAVYLKESDVTSGLRSHYPRLADDWNDIHDVYIVRDEDAFEAATPTGRPTTPAGRKRKTVHDLAKKKRVYKTDIGGERGKALPNVPNPGSLPEPAPGTWPPRGE
jgi:hypothetical protein